MLRPDLPKENIDGEAIIWASGRLTALPARHKYLIVLSDGAPVDDSTLLENGPTYLWDHLREAIAEIVHAGAINLASMGIGYRTDQLYPTSHHIDVPDQLGEALIAFIEEILTSDRATEPETD